VRASVAGPRLFHEIDETFKVQRLGIPSSSPWPKGKEMFIFEMTLAIVSPWSMSSAHHVADGYHSFRNEC
jgi:hypothetical protein